MSDGEHGAVGELCPDGGLDQVVRLQVHGRRRLVQHQDLGLPQQGAAQTDQLALAHTVQNTGQVRSAGRGPDISWCWPTLCRIQVRSGQQGSSQTDQAHAG